MMMFPSAQFSAWLFYAIMFISFSQTLLHQPNAENRNTLLEIIEKSTKIVDNLALKEKMSTEMKKKIYYCKTLAGTIVVDEKDHAKPKEIFIQNLVSKSAQFLENYKKTERMLYTYADVYDWMYLIDVTNLLRDNLVAYEKKDAESHQMKNHTEKEVNQILALKAIFEEIVKKLENEHENFKKVENEHKEGTQSGGKHKFYIQIPTVKQRDEILTATEHISKALKKMKNLSKDNAKKVKDEKKEFENQIQRGMNMKRIDLEEGKEKKNIIYRMAKCMIDIVYYEWEKNKKEENQSGEMKEGNNAGDGIEGDNVKAMGMVKVDDHHDKEAAASSSKIFTKKTSSDDGNVEG